MEPYRTEQEKKWNRGLNDMKNWCAHVMDDVQFLKDNSDEDSYLALIDSANRDTKVWPTAANFQVCFDTPFTLVYGIDLLGVSVPRTEYTVSQSRNVLVFSYGAASENQKHTVTIPEGDYDTLNFLAAMNSQLSLLPSSNNNIIQVSNSSSVPTISNKVVLSCGEPFTLYLSESSVRLVLGLADPVNPSFGGYTAPGWAPGGPDTVSSVLTPDPTASPSSALASGTATSNASRVTAYVNPSQSFTAQNSGIVISLSASFTVIGEPVSSSLVWTVLSAAGQVCAVGTVQVDTDVVLSTGYSTEDQVALLAGSGYLLQFTDPVNGDVNNCYGVQTDASGALCATVNVQFAVNSVSPPGLLDLTGERYIVLRCPEIEGPINKARAFEKWTAGVGMIQLGTYGYSVQAYDYTAYPPRSFQPIGSLSSLTLSFVKADGSLYDFKGLNLQLLLLIRFRVPRTPPGGDRQHPEYQPYLPRLVSQGLQDEIRWDNRYGWMPSAHKFRVRR